MSSVPDADRPDLEERIRAEVERTVAPYVGVAPPYMVAKLRELAERYWRENPAAQRVLRLQDQAQRARSGTEARQPGGEAAPQTSPEAAAGGRKKV